MTSSKTPGYLRKSRHMRAVFLLVASVAVLLVALLVSLGLQYAKANQLSLQAQVPQTQTSSTTVSTNTNNSAPQQSVFAPDLASFVGATFDDVMAVLQHGATVTRTQTTYRQGVEATLITIVLTGEPADSLAGTPTVYLLVDTDFVVLEAGYKAGMAYLGYGNLSFVDAVENAHVVENTLTEAGLPVPAGTVTVPANKADYASYGLDGITLAFESYEFTGEENGFSWRCSVDYDYTQANATGNLANTVRVITVYVS
ncbi:MAG: histone-lysine N-methyltransferase [Coriobacteriia bacterium]|nr:histone-lysine N-methyltransferase [Coriobacteriia bacterium]